MTIKCPKCGAKEISMHVVFTIDNFDLEKEKGYFENDYTCLMCKYEFYVKCNYKIADIDLKYYDTESFEVGEERECK